MSKIVLIWIVFGPQGDPAVVQWEGWVTMKECENALESLTEPAPEDQWSPRMLGKCIWVPK